MTNELAIRILAGYVLGTTEQTHEAVKMAVKALLQPELTEKVEDILTYLDTELHPIVSPEHWNVYSDLYDMISALPSAQSERKKGKWMKWEAPNGYTNGSKCSKCGYTTSAVSHYGTNYCPNCGADMREEKEDEV